MSLKAGKRAFDGVVEKQGARVATDCPLAAIHLEQGAGREERPVHPVQILARAYKKPGSGGFEKAVEKENV